MSLRKVNGFDIILKVMCFSKDVNVREGLKALTLTDCPISFAMSVRNLSALVPATVIY